MVKEIRLSTHSPNGRLLSHDGEMHLYIIG